MKNIIVCVAVVIGLFFAIKHIVDNASIGDQCDEYGIIQEINCVSITTAQGRIIPECRVSLENNRFTTLNSMHLKGEKICFHSHPIYKEGKK